MKEILKKISKIISTAIFVLLMIIIVFIVFYIIRINVYTKQDRLGEIKLNFYTIISQSMYPTIKAGDIIITYKNSDNKYNTNDIITFVSDGVGAGLTVTHRIKEISSVNGKYSYKTKGDSNNTADSKLVAEENVIGKVIFRIPKAGYIQQFLVTGFGWIVAILLPCLGIIIYDVIKIVKKIGKKTITKVKDGIVTVPVIEEPIVESVKEESVIVDNKVEVPVVELPDPLGSNVMENEPIVPFEEEFKVVEKEAIIGESDIKEEEIIDNSPVVNKFAKLRSDDEKEEMTLPINNQGDISITGVINVEPITSQNILDDDAAVLSPIDISDNGKELPPVADSPIEEKTEIL